MVAAADPPGGGRDDPGVPEVDLPRLQTGAQPQRLLSTLLGDYWYDRTEHLPSAALVTLLGDFGVSAVGARAALSRLARRGVLESSKVGRYTYYGLTPRAAEVLGEGAWRILSFGQRYEPWDGHWRIAAFSVPEDQRDARRAVRNRLRWLGFAPLYDGMWVTPRPVAAAARRGFDELGVVGATVLTTTVDPPIDGPRHPIEAWDLTDLRRRYLDFIASYSGLLARARDGAVDASEALVARTAVMEAWRYFPSLDPDLPVELLPSRWPRLGAHRVFAEIYDALAPNAVDRVREVVADYSGELAGLVRRHHSGRPDEAESPKMPARRLLTPTD
jgi:phenylacetic acid degradation operon negative regulatory protein